MGKLYLICGAAGSGKSTLRTMAISDPDFVNINIGVSKFSDRSVRQHDPNEDVRNLFDHLGKPTTKTGRREYFDRDQNVDPISVFGVDFSYALNGQKYSL